MDAFPCPKRFDVSKIRHAFLNVFTSIMRNYQQFFTFQENKSAMEDNESLKHIYQTQDFLLDLDFESRLFMKRFTTSQSFYVFIRGRHPNLCEQDPSILFFDECIKAKRNRSILTLQKEIVEFLTDESFRIRDTIVFDGPNTNDINSLPPSKLINFFNFLEIPFPHNLNDSWLSLPRAFPCLINAFDDKLVNLHIRSITFHESFHSKWVSFNLIYYSDLYHG